MLWQLCLTLLLHCHVCRLINFTFHFSDPVISVCRQIRLLLSCLHFRHRHQQISFRRVIWKITFITLSIENGNPKSLSGYILSACPAYCPPHTSCSNPVIVFIQSNVLTSSPVCIELNDTNHLFIRSIEYSLCSLRLLDITSSIRIPSPISHNIHTFSPSIQKTGHSTSICDWFSNTSTSVLSSSRALHICQMPPFNFKNRTLNIWNIYSYSHSLHPKYFSICRHFFLLYFSFLLFP